MRKYFLYAFLAAFLLSSCGSAKKIAYLQDLQNEAEAMSNMYTNVVKPGDILIIAVTSIKQELALPYNLYSVRSQMATSTQRYSLSSAGYTETTRQETEGYLVDEQGFISFPGLGMIHIGGLTRLEISKKIEDLLRDLVPEPIVTVSFVNFKITILGEVAKPGAYNVTMDRVSIFDALGMAGDMTVYGKRSNILVIREGDGTRQTARLDIKSKDIFKSPFFYLQQNDVVVVEPINAKARSISMAVQNLPLFVSLGSLATSIAMVILNYSK